MEKEIIDLNVVIANVHEQQKKRGLHDCEYPANHYLMNIISAISRAADSFDCDYEDFDRDMESFSSFSRSYEMNILGSTADELANAGIQILDFMGLRGIKIADMDLLMLHQAPACFTDPEFYKTFNVLLYDLVGTLTHRKEEDVQFLDCLRLHEKGELNDPEFEEIIEERLGPVEEISDIDLRTAHGYENYMLSQNLVTVLGVIMSWFKRNAAKSFDWHLKARLFYDTDKE